MLAISQDKDKLTVAQRAEDRSSHAPAPKAAFYAEWWDELLDKEVSTLTTRKQRRERELAATQSDQAASDTLEDKEAEIKDDLPFPANDRWTYPVEFEKPLDQRKLGKRSPIC